jgi:hypothetical protein
MPLAPAQHATSWLIRKLESIAILSDEERRAIESLPVRINVLNARQDIVRDGDKPSHCCLVLDGWTCRYKLLSQGKRQIFSFPVPGDIPDLQSLHVPTMDHSFATVTKATVAFISHESVRELTAQYPNIAALLWRDTLLDAGIFREWMVGLGRALVLRDVPEASSGGAGRELPLPDAGHTGRSRRCAGAHACAHQPRAPRHARPEPDHAPE